MLYMNTDEVAEALGRHAEHPVLGPATQTLANLVVWTNQNSDGWAYWPKPCRAAEKLQRLIQAGPAAATEAELKAALRPVKAFRTRQNADFEVVEKLPEPKPEGPPMMRFVVEVSPTRYTTDPEQVLDIVRRRLDSLRDLLGDPGMWVSYQEGKA